MVDKNQTPQTIAQKFPRGVDMDDITCGLWEEREEGVSDDQRESDDIENQTLLSFCEDIIKERGRHPYRGYKTNGDIMVEAMLRYTKKYGDDVPLYWYPIAKELRRLRGKDLLTRHGTW